MNKKIKLCTKCGISKPVSAFSLHKYNSSGFKSECKECTKIYREKHKTTISAYAKKYYIVNKEKIKAQANNYKKSNQNKIKKTVKVYYRANKEERINYSKTYYYANKEKILKYSKNYQKANRDKINKQRKKARQASPKDRLNRSMSEAFRNLLKNGKGGKSWRQLVPYTLADLIKHLEKQFTNDMTWENYGFWHLDHKIPKSAFNFTKPEHEDFKHCWALSNLQPMWAKENIIKSNRFKKHFQPSLLL